MEVQKKQELKIGSRYRHYRNRQYYRVVGIGHHTETMEEVVIYQALYNTPGFGENHLWVRPKSMFLEQVVVNEKLVCRFELVD